MKKKILLIGCGGILGNAFVEHYSSQFDIIGVARHETETKNLLREFVLGDVSWDWDRILNEVLNSYEVDALVYNAVYYDITPLMEKKNHHFSTELQTNLVSPLAFAKRILQESWMKYTLKQNQERNRSMVFISSMSGIKVFPHIGQGTYSATKAALNMLTLHMHEEWKKYGVRINALAFERIGQTISSQDAAKRIAQFIEGYQSGQIAKFHEQN